MPDDHLWEWNPPTLRLAVHVQPSASRTEWAGRHGERLKLRVAAPPLENQANQACLAFLAKFFQVPKRQVALLHGQTSRAKTFTIQHPDPASLDRLRELDAS